MQSIHFFFLYITQLIFYNYFYFYFPLFNSVVKKYSSVKKILDGQSPFSHLFKLRLWRYLKIDRMLNIFEDKTMNTSSEIHSLLIEMIFLVSYFLPIIEEGMSSPKFSIPCP